MIGYDHSSNLVWIRVKTTASHGRTNVKLYLYLENTLKMVLGSETMSCITYITLGILICQQNALKKNIPEMNYISDAPTTGFGMPKKDSTI